MCAEPACAANAASLAQRPTLDEHEPGGLLQIAMQVVLQRTRLAAGRLDNPFEHGTQLPPVTIFTPR